MYYDCEEILRTYKMYRESQIDKTKLPISRGPKDGEKEILTTHLVRGNLHFKDGDDEYSFDANTGPDNNGEMSDGTYNVGVMTEQSGETNAYDIDGTNSGYKIVLTADEGQGITRDKFLIHPTVDNTHGRIGIKGKAQQIKSHNLHPRLAKKYKKINLKVRDVNGIKEKIISDDSKYLNEYVIPIRQK